MLDRESRINGLMANRRKLRETARDVLARFGFHPTALQHRESLTAIEKLRIAARGPEHIVGRLSGGNQQKVILGKWLATEPSVLLLDEPTRGIDIGAKDEIYDLIGELAEQGAPVLFASSEIP